MDLLEQLQYAVTIALVGVIWTIQLVHYPAFKYISSSRFVDFERMHTLKITLLVAPLMLMEAITVCLLLYLSAFAMGNLLLALIVALIWIATFFVSVPCHRILAQGKDERVIQRLITTNWIRTFLWSTKLVLLYFL